MYKFKYLFDVMIRPACEQIYIRITKWQNDHNAILLNYGAEKNECGSFGVSYAGTVAIPIDRISY